MAGSMEQVTLNCPVCFQDFEADGDHVPRLLPCAHSLCHTCIGQRNHNNRLECPTCRMKYEAKNEESFPQNKYILTMMRRKTRLQGEEMEESRRCPKHGEKEILFCREDHCKIRICSDCLSEAHLGHKVVSIKHETKDVLATVVKNIEFTQERLNKRIRKVKDTSQDVLKKIEANVLEITMEKEKMIRDSEKKKDEIIDQYDGMIKQAEDEKRELSEASGNDLTAMKENVELLNMIKQSIEEEKNTYEDALEKLDTVKGVIENLEHLPRIKTYEYSEYAPGQENLFGKLIKKEKSVFSAPKLQCQGQ